MAVQFSISGTETCRLCLHKVEAFINIVEDKYKYLIKALTSLEISEDDGLPKIACISCVHELQLATKIKTRITESHKKLERLLENKKWSSAKAVNEDLEYRVSIVANPDTIDEHSYSSTNNQNQLSDATQSTTNIQNAAKKIDIYLCKKCGKTFYNDKKGMTDHIANHNKEKCEKCGLFIKCENMTKHLEFHQDGPKVCEMCGRVLKNSGSLRNHIFFMHVTKADRFKCDICPRSFRRKVQWMNHKHVNHSSKAADSPAVCEFCGRMFTRKNLSTHMSYHHKMKPDKYKCSECPKAFKKKVDLTRHRLNIHSGTLHLECEHCGKKFSNPWDTQKHIKMQHLTVRSFQCEYCQRRFGSLYTLKYHTLKHTNKTPHKCSHCDAAFKQMNTLRSHMESEHNVTEDKQIACEFCDRLYATEFALKLHMNVHQNHYYECNHCLERFKVKVLFIDHLKDEHGMFQGLVNMKRYLKNDVNEAFEEGQTS